MNDDFDVVCCTRCGVPLANPEELFCAFCREVLSREKPREHTIKHDEQPRFATNSKKRERKERERTCRMSINEICKIAAEHGLSYGQTVARLKDGRI